MSILLFKLPLLKTKNEFCKKIIPTFFMSKPFPRSEILSESTLAGIFYILYYLNILSPVY